MNLPLRLVAVLAALCAAALAFAREGDTVRLTEATFSAVATGRDGQPVRLPHLWRNATDRPVVARYVLTMPVPAGVTTWAVQIGGTNLPFEAIVNGRHAHENGGPDSPPVRLMSWRAAPAFRIPVDLLRPGANELELLVYGAAHGAHALGPVTAGPAEAIAAQEMRGWIVYNAVPLVVASVLAAVGIIALALWRGRREFDLFFWLGAGATLWALHNFLYQLPHALLPSPHWRVLMIGLYAWYPLLLAIFFLRFSFQRWPAFERAAVAAMFGSVPLLYAAIGLGHGDAASIVLRGAVLLFLAAAFVGVIRYALRARDAHGYALLGAAALCVAAAAYDYVHNLTATDIRPYFLVSYAGVALVMLTAWMLLDRYQQAYRAYRDRNVDLAARLQEANAELQLRLAQTQAAREQAEQANVAKSRFFAAASHDLRQPLHSLGLFTSALDEQLASPAARETARGIRESIVALESLFDSLLDLSRLDAGVVSAQPRSVALQSLFDRLAREFHLEAVERDLRLRFVPTRAVVRTDPLLLGRILANLVGNALHYTRRGGVAVGVRRRNGRAVLTVCDTGIGIAPDQQGLVFEEFYQVDNPGRDRRRGLGLGLAIVQRLARLLDHPLSLRSVPGRGTCFELALPYAEGPVAAIEEAPPAFDGEALRGVRVLVVDDDVMVRESTGALLRQWRADPRGAASAAEAQRAIAGGFAPELLIVDLRLGEALDGIDLIGALRQALGREVPALLVSGDTGAAELMRVRRCGIPFLTKPVAPAKLRSMLHSLIGLAALAGAPGAT